uniref:ABC transporter domain-containing protein n=1 Tax=Acrobeloides nanus TaxID=290746 RepID=A0A914EIA1_9BILA
MPSSKSSSSERSGLLSFNEIDGIVPPKYGSLLESQKTTTSHSNSIDNLTPVTLSWHHLVVHHRKSGKRILNDISGIAKPGEFVALMGASGAGKTTLLNTLLSRNLQGLEIEGSVLVEGCSLGRKMTQVSGYVQQDELFMPTLTVYEHLSIQAKLRLVGFSENERKQRVEEIMQELGLNKCRHARIGLTGVKKGISGGEAKRLSIASELLNNPPILFLDEPTTGLDSFLAESVVNVMTKLAKSGRTLICTIHQPSSVIYRKFDKVMFLARGRLAYFGTPENAVETFARFGYHCPRNYNPADMIIESLAVEAHHESQSLVRIDKICNDFAQSDESRQFQEVVENAIGCAGKLPKPRKTTGYFTQLTALLQRSWLDNLRNPSLARAKISQKIIMGFFVGLLYFQTSITTTGISNLNGALFYLVAELTYATLFGILTCMPADYPLLVREYHDGLYSVGSYFVARSMSYLPLFTLDGLTMLTIAYWMIGLAPSALHFLIAVGISILIEQAAAAFGIMLSTVSPSYPVAVSIAGPVLNLLNLTGGLFANIGELPFYISWIQYLSWFRYGFEAFAINQWLGVSVDGECVKKENSSCESTDAILNKYSFKRSHFSFDLLFMFLLIVLFYLIGFIGLLIRVRRAR